MGIENIPVVTVTYNAPHLLQGLLASFRQFYRNPIHVVDGSDEAHAGEIRAIAESFEGVHLHAQGYNIHHGPGLAWAIETLPLGPRVLILDSDVVVRQPGFIEALDAALGERDYGAGGMAYVNREGFNVPYGYGTVPYLHPPCMLCNVAVMKQWPLPIKHGAPMVSAMLALHDAGKSDLLKGLDWALNDVMRLGPPIYLEHLTRGTVISSGGYHLDEWMAETAAKQQAAPQRGYNPDVLALIPPTAVRVAEIGCSTGKLAAALKAQRANVHYRGFEFDVRAIEQARSHCDEVLSVDIETQGDDFWRTQEDRDCWIFGDVLEHLRDPWKVLARIRTHLPPGGCVVASVPNAQHWSIQGRLAIGEFRYEASGLLDRTHLRWFTRVTLFELFASAGLRVETGVPRIFDEPQREPVLAAIRQMAIAMGRDPEGAVRDALPLQYVMRAVAA